MRSILLLYMTSKSLQITLVEFLEEQEMVATFAAIDPEKNVGKVNSNSNEEAGNYISPLKALKIDSDDCFEIKTVKRKLILSFVVKALFVAILTIVALVLSLCHSSHQFYPPSQVSSTSLLSQDHLGIEGSVFKAKPEYSTPRSVKIHWVNVVEGGAPNGFNMITESNDINETNFKISVNKLHMSMTFFLAISISHVCLLDENDS